MIKYKSTRGENLYKFSDVILKGIADDGGLFVPIEIPKLSLKKLERLSSSTYQERALFILNLFRIDFPKSSLVKIVNKAYADNFDVPQIAPLIRLKDKQYILELWHGPTSSFKDLALQLIPLFFSEALRFDNLKRTKRKKSPLRYLILAATSGDTGKAALEGYKNLEGIEIIVFYPYRGVSKLQELSMITQEGENLAVFGIDGDFDDVQECIKEVFCDRAFNQILFQNYNFLLSSANSINWGRLLPQIIYHFSSYLDLLNQKVVKSGEKIDIAVPTGNFGNILAAFYAKKMGLPLKRLICATNENNVLTEFLQTGQYDIKKRNLIKTSSPSMDILLANNLERLLYEITKDPEKIRFWMEELKQKGKFKVDKKTQIILKDIFYADWVSDKDCLSTIKRIYSKNHYLIDPHTAVAQTVVERYQQKKLSKRPIVICSTAHWSKFAVVVYRALVGLNEEDEFISLSKISKSAPFLTIPKAIRDLNNKKIRFKLKHEANKKVIEKTIIEYLKRSIRK